MRRFLFQAALAAVSSVLLCGAALAGSVPRPSSWPPSDLIEPAELLKQVAPSRSRKPIVVCVGYHVLYQGAHIRGAAYEGPASLPSGLAKLRRWSRTIPKSASVVIYCGCCPFQECPNVRPAFEALKREGFKHVRVLYLPHSFARDWVGKGYPSVRER